MAYVTVNNIIWPRTGPYSTGSSPGTVRLDAAEERIAYVIRWPKTGTLKKVGWTISSVSSPVLTVAVSIETVADAVGVPIATTDAGKTLYAANAVSADITNPSAGARFDAINSTTGISVTKGELAAITIRAKTVTSGYIEVTVDLYNAAVHWGG